MSISRIFVENDAIAFFDVEKPKSRVIDVSDISKISKGELHSQLYNFLIGKKEASYFETHNHKEDVRTVSVTTPCIVFCAYINNGDGTLKSSGVFHSDKRAYLTDGLDKLIDGVRSNSDVPVILKAVGGDCTTKYRGEEGMKEIRDYLRALRNEKNIFMDPSYMLFTEGYCRITEFDPKTGQVITYLKGERKAVL